MVDNPLVTFFIHSKGNKIVKGKLPKIILKLSNFGAFLTNSLWVHYLKTFFVRDPLGNRNVGIKLPILHAKNCIPIPKIKIRRLCLVKSVDNSFFIMISDSALYLKVTLWLKRG